MLVEDQIKEELDNIQRTVDLLSGHKAKKGALKAVVECLMKIEEIEADDFEESRCDDQHS